MDRFTTPIAAYDFFGDLLAKRERWVEVNMVQNRQEATDVSAHDDKSLIGAMVGDGRPLLIFRRIPIHHPLSHILGLGVRITAWPERSM